MSETLSDFSVNKILAGAIIALLSWNIYTTNRLTIDVAVLTEKIGRIENAVYQNKNFLDYKGP